ncbi:HAD family hydrolase [Thermochromatium tepidum]|uniref:HAD-IA family hydrolase n=1 Tax=Thermochromatium tepidum ATCC 43061 TaxID=316276 RepID=A0A6I6E8L8_THETI|nr:HAD-IA family hydrolase [Thermochromatium tepidum]QGU31666.1 HAD-IA family hydrolase [Thermochromatium tepidum ATCC 43061]
MADRRPPRDGLVLFDLDGTFADTAPDMAAALDRLLRRHGRAPLPFARVRPHASHGAPGILRVGFGLKPGDPEYEPLRLEYLRIYESALVDRTAPFPGMVELVNELDSRGLPWGIVTNKSTALAEPLLEQIGFLDRVACLVCGDTTPRPKPHPDPLLYACDLLGIAPERGWYVGDAERDIQAGLAAGMGTLAALFGYLGPDDDPRAWGAHGMIEHPLQLLDWLDSEANRND